MDIIKDLYEYKFCFLIQPPGPALKLYFTVINTSVENAKKNLILKFGKNPDDIKKEFLHLGSSFDMYMWWNLDTKVKPCRYSTSSELLYGDGYIVLSHNMISLRDYINTCNPEEIKLNEISVKCY